MTFKNSVLPFSRALPQGAVSQNIKNIEKKKFQDEGRRRIRLFFFKHKHSSFESNIKETPRAIRSNLNPSASVIKFHESR